MLKRLRHNIRVIKERDPAARNSLEVLLLYPGLHAVMLHRPAHFLYKHHMLFLARLLAHFSRFLTGIEIHPGATIGWGLFIDHGSGVVIGETTVIGDNCTIYQGATLGGTGKDDGKRHPTLGNDVMVGSGARILGPFKVGDHARIASGAVVLEEIPPNSTAVGVPAKVVKINGLPPVSDDLDQVHLPDPVESEIQQMAKRICMLEHILAELTKEKQTKGEDKS